MLQEQKLLDTIQSDFAVKNYKRFKTTGDHIAYSGTLYFKGKKAAELHDDGWGGEVDINFISESQEKEIQDFLVSNNMAQILFENGYDFYSSASEITEHTIMNAIFSALFNQKEQEKTRLSMIKKTQKSIIVRIGNQYTDFSFRGVNSLEDMVSRYRNGLELIQKAYDDAKKIVAQEDDAEIINTVEQLTKLKVVL